MKLLFDQNLSFRLVMLLADRYPNSSHVRDAGLRTASDTRVWQFAQANGFMVVSKDEDFYQLSLRLGHPPKLIWIRRGNCSTQDIHEILRQHADRIEAFEQDATTGCLVLF